jgi:hypothetical protein
LVFQYLGIGDHHARANSLLFVPERWIKCDQDDHAAGKFHLPLFQPALTRNPADARTSLDVHEIVISFRQTAYPVGSPGLSQVFALRVRRVQRATELLFAAPLKLILDRLKNEPASVTLPSVDISD